MWYFAFCLSYEVFGTQCFIVQHTLRSDQLHLRCSGACGSCRRSPSRKRTSTGAGGAHPLAARWPQPEESRVDPRQGSSLDPLPCSPSVSLLASAHYSTSNLDPLRASAPWPFGLFVTPAYQTFSISFEGAEYGEATDRNRTATCICGSLPSGVVWEATVGSCREEIRADIMTRTSNHLQNSTEPASGILV